MRGETESNIVSGGISKTDILRLLEDAIYRKTVALYLSDRNAVY